MLVVAEQICYCDDTHGWPDWQSRALFKLRKASPFHSSLSDRQLQLRSLDSKTGGTMSASLAYELSEKPHTAGDLALLAEVVKKCQRDKLAGMSSSCLPKNAKLPQ